MQVFSVDSSRSRADEWAAVRIEKSDEAMAETASLGESIFLSIENSVETGLLGADFVGIPVYGWLLIASVLALLLILVRKIRRRSALKAGLLFVLVSASVSQDDTSYAPVIVFRADDPLLVDPDTLAFRPPSERSFSESHDFLVNSLGAAGALDGPAVNVNTHGDVPSSSWFQDRHYHQRLRPSELRRGSAGESGPDTSAAWSVVDVERDGKSIGMQIVDGTGTRYILKLDAPEHPETSTGAEVVSSRFLHAIGYHVPDNYLVRFRPSILQRGNADVSRRRLLDILRSAYRYPDGTYRAMASKYVDGRPVGPFELHGTRADDPNDIFPHELRRELRGLRLIAAWLNHTDMRAENTLTSAISSHDGTYVRHYLIDFGTTLGGSPFGEQRPWAGYEYWLEPLQTLKRVLSFGLYDPAWSDLEIPAIRGVGRFEASHFDPGRWVPIQPNAAFQRMDAADAFWAAARISAFTDQDIRAVVASGRYQDERTVEYISRILSDRRDRILSRYLYFGGGMDQFRITEDGIVFRDLLAAIPSGAADQAAERFATWESGGLVIHEGVVTGDTLPMPTPDVERVTIRTAGHGTSKIYLGAGRVLAVERCDTSGRCDSPVERQALRRRVFLDAGWRSVDAVK